MLKGFRDFILRGNIIDLAVAVVIGTAFVALVKQFTDSFITPLIAVFTGGGEVGGKFTVSGQVFSYGVFIGAVITFLITAAIVYFLVVVPMGRLLNLYSKPLVEEPAL
ncbi:MAG: large conductance mechanosensitive channel protein MscL, partial [Pseudonocardiaceae bacterium]